MCCICNHNIRNPFYFVWSKARPPVCIERTAADHFPSFCCWPSINSFCCWNFKILNYDWSQRPGSSQTARQLSSPRTGTVVPALPPKNTKQHAACSRQKEASALAGRCDSCRPCVAGRCAAWPRCCETPATAAAAEATCHKSAGRVQHAAAISSCRAHITAWRRFKPGVTTTAAAAATASTAATASGHPAAAAGDHSQAVHVQGACGPLGLLPGSRAGAP